MSLVREQLVAVSCRELPWVARRQSKSCGNISVARARGNNTHARAYRRIIDQRWYGGIISLYHWNQSREIDTLSTPVHHLTTETREREEGCAVWTKSLWTTPPSQSAQVEVVTRCHVTFAALAVTWHPLHRRSRDIHCIRVWVWPLTLPWLFIICVIIGLTVDHFVLCL